MKVPLAAILLYSLTLTAQETAPKPALSHDPLSPERMEIYRQFLAGYGSGSTSKFSVSVTTVQFSPRDYDLKDCLKQFKSSDLATPVIHAFQPDAFPSDRVVLVDPTKHKVRDPGDAIRRGASVDDAVAAGFASAILTFSEIAFDASHTHAAFSYSFYCGGLCGHGGTVVYELKQGKWEEDKHVSCGSWIS